MAKTEEIIKELESMGFSKLEAASYVLMVQKGEMTGYQIAKLLNVSRASIYPVLDSLYKKGIVNLIPGDTNIYSAEPPDIVIEKLKTNYIKSAENAKNKLASISKDSPKDRFINIEGYDNVIEKTRELILSAEKEILIHTDIDLFLFEKELAELKKRNVRVIVFSWEDKEIRDLPIEFYTRMENYTICYEYRIMLVIDHKMTMIASNLNNSSDNLERKNIKINDEVYKSEFLGTFTENKLMVHIIAEHIHFDIYLLKLMKKYGNNLINEEIQLGTIMER